MGFVKLIDRRHLHRTTTDFARDLSVALRTARDGGCTATDDSGRMAGIVVSGLRFQVCRGRSSAAKRSTNTLIDAMPAGMTTNLLNPASM